MGAVTHKPTFADQSATGETGQEEAFPMPADQQSRRVELPAELAGAPIQLRSLTRGDKRQVGARSGCLLP